MPKAFFNRSIAVMACVAATVIGIAFTSHTLARQTAPATTQRARFAVMMPRGFHLISFGERNAICDPADDAWVTAALKTAPPATLPSTMPADLSARLIEKRGLFKARLASDLAMNDSQTIDQFYDQVLLPRVKRLESLHIPVFYLVCSRDRLKSLLKEGDWQDQRFYYNKTADDVTYNSDMQLDGDNGTIDDMTVPAISADGATPAQNGDTLKKFITHGEEAIADALSRRAQVLTQLSVIDFLHQQAFAPLALKDDQQWLAMGLEAVLSTRYMSDLAGLNSVELMARITRDNPRNPIRADSIDLLHPPDKNSLRPEWVSAYGDAFRVKSARVVSAWFVKCGDGAASLALVSMRASPAKDGPALIKLIQTATGADLSEEVKSK